MECNTRTPIARIQILLQRNTKKSMRNNKVLSWPNVSDTAKGQRNTKKLSLFQSPIPFARLCGLCVGDWLEKIRLEQKIAKTAKILRDKKPIALCSKNQRIAFCVKKHLYQDSLASLSHCVKKHL